MTDLRAALDDPEAFGWMGPPTYAIAYAAAIRDVKAAIPEGAVLVTEERLARALDKITGTRVMDDPDAWAAAILRHLREVPVPPATADEYLGRSPLALEVGPPSPGASEHGL